MNTPFNVDFANVVSEAQDWIIPGDGVDKVYDLFEHLADEGTIYNFDLLSPEECTAMLAVLWVQLRDLALKAVHE